jgi:N-acetylneuraminate synthase
MKPENQIVSEFNTISKSSPTYFIADIAANHDHSLKRATELIKLAADAGANAAKFQNFKAETIVSNRGFIELGKKISHQSKWSESVYEVYKAAELPLDWTEKLIEQCQNCGIDYFTAPYDLEMIRILEPSMPFFKVGSGDISWKESLKLMLSSNKSLFIATGASTMEEVTRAVELVESFPQPYVLMQCNTNYTGEEANFDYLNLNVLSNFAKKFPRAILGLSDHSKGHVAVLGAVTLGARVIEKHFTDDQSRPGPDHAFSLNPVEWENMVKDTRILERCLGSGEKIIELNEIDSRIVQRRGLRYAKSLKAGSVISPNDLVALRPLHADSIDPWDAESLIGKTISVDVASDQAVTQSHFV